MCSPAYQQQRHVDVNVLKHNELFLHFDRDQPWTVQFSFHPVSHTAVLPFKGSGQSPDGQTRRGRAVSKRKAVGTDEGRSHLLRQRAKTVTQTAAYVYVVLIVFLAPSELLLLKNSGFLFKKTARI